MTTPAQLLRVSCHNSAKPDASSTLDGLDARILLAHVLAWPRAALITRADETLAPQAVQRYQQLVLRRLAGEPIAQLVGQREFYSLMFNITPDVLIPRPETELLVELALKSCAKIAQPRVLDLGTGSGAIAVSIGYARPDASITATDRSSRALALAHANAARLLPPNRPAGPLAFFAGDWFDALAQTKPIAPFHVIVSNPPYLRANDPHLEQGDLRFEPRGALTDEADGLDAIRAIVARAPEFLSQSGWLWIEHGYDQSEPVAALFRNHGFNNLRAIRDLAGILRVCGARLAG